MKKFTLLLLFICNLSFAQDKADLRVDNYLSFNEAFEIAYLHLGPDATFEWRGKTYSTSTSDVDIKPKVVVKKVEDATPKFLPLIKEESVQQSSVELAPDLFRPWSIYVGALSMGSDKKGSQSIGGISAGVSYSVNERLTYGLGFTQRGFKQKAEIYYYEDDEDDRDDDYDDRQILNFSDDDDECFIDYCAGENDYFEDFTFSGIELWATYDVVSQQNFSVWSGFSYAYLFEVEEENDFGGDDITFENSVSEHDYGVMLGFTAKNDLFSTKLSYFKSLADYSFENVSLQFSIPLNI